MATVFAAGICVGALFAVLACLAWLIRNNPYH